MSIAVPPNETAAPTPREIAREPTRVLGGLMSGIALALTMFIEAVGYGIVAPTLPFLARRFGADEAQIGLLVGLYAAVGLLVIIPMGTLANRFGRRPVILFGLASLTVASIGFAWAPSFFWLVVTRSIQGLGGIAIWVGALTMAADLSPGSRMGRSLSWITGAWSLGFVIGPALGGLGNVRTPFLIYALLSGVAFVAGFMSLPESGRRGIRSTLRGVVRILRLPTVLGSAAATFTLSFYYGAIEAFVPLMIDELGVQRMGIGLLFAVAGVPSIALPRITGYLADRMGDVRLIIIGLAFAAAFNASFLFLLRTIPLWVLFLGIGMVEVFVYVPSVALLHRGISRDDRIFATGSHNYAFSAGFFLGPLLGGLVLSINGYGLLFALLTAVMIGGVLAMIATRRDTAGGS
jgi:predicted MFS family arabinose efflux permease